MQILNIWYNLDIISEITQNKINIYHKKYSSFNIIFLC